MNEYAKQKEFCGHVLLFMQNDRIVLPMGNRMGQQWKSLLLLVLAALIWGAAFSAQSIAGEHVGAFTFNATRFYIGTLTLLPVIAVLMVCVAFGRFICLCSSALLSLISGI